MNEQLIVAGFGGQGVLSIGKMVALSGMLNNKQVSWLPSYTSEMRGGTANCNVIVSDEPVGSPIIRRPNALIIMNLPSLLKYEKMAVPGAKMLLNTSMVDREPERTDITVYKIPFNDLAREAGFERGTNMLVAGAYAAITQEISLENLYTAIEHTFTGRKEKFIEPNKKMAKVGYDYATEHFLKGKQA